MMVAEKVFETLDTNAILKLLIAREDFAEPSYSFKTVLYHKLIAHEPRGVYLKTPDLKTNLCVRLGREVLTSGPDL